MAGQINRAGAAAAPAAQASNDRTRSPSLAGGFSALEGLGYRQLTAIWRLRGLWRHTRGRSDWGVMTRRGFSRSQAGA